MGKQVVGVGRSGRKWSPVVPTAIVHERPDGRCSQPGAYSQSGLGRPRRIGDESECGRPLPVFRCKLWLRSRDSKSQPSAGGWWKHRGVLRQLGRDRNQRQLGQDAGSLWLGQQHGLKRINSKFNGQFAHHGRFACRAFLATFGQRQPFLLLWKADAPDRSRRIAEFQQGRAGLSALPFKLKENRHEIERASVHERVRLFFRKPSSAGTMTRMQNWPSRRPALSWTHNEHRALQ